MLKLCETCGAALVRHPNLSRGQWEAKRFCNRKCSAARLIKPRVCACGCGERPLKGRKYMPGHRRLWTASKTGGYIRVFRPGHPLAMSDGLVLEHRWLMYEMAIPVPEGFHVHHRNGVKHDNRWSNLQVLTASEHHRHHIREAGYVTNQFGTFPLREEC
jgi:hypothetical protein